MLLDFDAYRSTSPLDIVRHAIAIIATYATWYCHVVFTM
jgi:hypothetical protein